MADMPPTWLALLLEVSIKAALLAAVAGIGLWILRVRNSNVQHRVWTAVLLGMLLLPLLVPVTPKVSLPAWLYPQWKAQSSASSPSNPFALPARSPNLKTALQATDAGPPAANQPVAGRAAAEVAPRADVALTPPAVERAAAPMKSSTSRSPTVSVSAVLLVVYLLGVFLLAGRLLAGLLGARRLVREAEPISLPPAHVRFVGATKVLVSPSVRVPLTVAWPRPCILLPTDWSSWSDSLLAAVLAHEQAHVRRGDHWVVLLAEWNRAIYWFHPVAWFVRRRLTTLAEQICDDAVIEQTGDRTGYARDLLYVAGRLAGGRRVEATGVAMVGKPQVERRIGAILDTGRPLARRLGLAGALALPIAAVSLTLLAAGLGGEEGHANAPSSETVATDSNEPSDAVAANDRPATVLPVLSGRIVDDTGAPVTDAQVEITGNKTAEDDSRFYRQSYDTKTDENGQYQFDRVEQADEFTVRITSERWVGLTKWRSLPRIQLGPESQVVRDFTLPRACRLRVQIVDESGAPVRNVSVYVASSEADRFENVEGVNTDKEGWVTIGGLRASDVDYLAGTSHDDFAFAKLLVKLDDPEKVVSRHVVLAKGVDVPGMAQCSDGKPAAGWTINAMPDWWHFGVTPRGKEIGQDGTFMLTHIVPGRYDVTVSVPEGSGMFRVVPALSSAPLPPSAGVLAVNLNTPSPHSMVAISGRVHFTGGSPTKRVMASAQSENREYLGDAFIEPDQQEFRIEPLPPGRYRVQFSSTEIDEKTIPNVVAPSDDLDIELHVTGQPVIHGKVVRGDTGEPVRSFRLRIAKLRTLRGPNYVPHAYWRAYDNPEGTFEVDTVGPGVYQLLIAADGLAWTRSEPINTDENQGQSLLLKLGTGTTLSGTVVDEVGRPIDGAKVVPLSSASGSMPRTIASFATDDGAVETVDGRFSLEHLTPGKDSLKVTHPDYCFALVENVEVPAEGATVAPITLTTGGTVEGHVYDANGEPESGVTLYFQDREGYGGSGDEEAGRFATAVSDANGYYEVQHLPSQLCYVQRAEQWNSWGVVRNAIFSENGKTHTLDFGGTQPVTGRLLVNGAPLANGKLELTGENPTFGIYKAFAQTDRDGAFVFWSPPTGRWTLYYLVPGRRSDWARVRELQITSGPQDLGTIEHQSVELAVSVAGLPASVTDQLRVVLREFNPKWMFGNTVGAQTPRQGADEPFEFTNVPPGTYEAVCYRPNHESVLEKVEVHSDKQRQEFTIEWPAGTASLHGTISEAVCGPGGCNPPHLWKSDRRFTALIVPNADGTYQLDDLPAGDYYVTSWDTRDAAPVVEFSLADGEDKSLDLTPDVYSPPPLGVGMLVLLTFTSDGQPLPGCEISMSGPEGKLRPSSTQQGRVTFVGPPGEYSLTVSYPGFESIRQQVTIRPTDPNGRATGNYELRIQLQREDNPGAPSVGERPRRRD